MVARYPRIASADQPHRQRGRAPVATSPKAPSASNQQLRTKKMKSSTPADVDDVGSPTSSSHIFGQRSPLGGTSTMGDQARNITYPGSRKWFSKPEVKEEGR